MDRRERMLTGLGLTIALALGAPGCRTPRSEVPPGKAFSGSGQAQPQAGAVGFGSAPHGPNGFAGLPSGSGEGLPGSNAAGQLGTPAPGVGNYGAPTNNTYGPPGTSSLATPPSSSLGAPSMSPPVGSDPAVGLPQTGTGPTGPAAGLSPITPSSAPAAGNSLPAPTQNTFDH